MDYEKAYKEALERAKVLMEEGRIAVEAGTTTCEYIFPELKMSKDERVKKAITHILYENYTDAAVIEGVEIAEIVAWLEKQGEQNHADKVEPKFKVGNWVTNGVDFTFKVMSIKDNMYYRDDDYSIDIETADKTFRLWTIDDAKDGDVLVYEGEIFMIKSYVLWNKIVYHCCYDGKNLHKYSVYYSLGKEDFDKIHPATKEQRNLLFNKMKGAGYEWDANEKVLVMIGIDNDDEDKQHEELMEDTETSIKQNPAWGEEDEEMINAIIADIQFTQKVHNHEVDQVVYEAVNIAIVTSKQTANGEN